MQVEDRFFYSAQMVTNRNPAYRRTSRRPEPVAGPLLPCNWLQANHRTAHWLAIVYIRNGLLDHMSVAIKMVKGQLITYKDELKWQNLAEKELGKAMVLPQEEKDVLASQDINNQEFFDLPHKCKECGAQYMSESELENHLILRIWCCLKCNRTFKYKESWTRHMRKALHVDVFTDAKAKAKAKRIQMARMARLKLITKELERRKSEKKELDDFKGQS